MNEHINNLTRGNNIEKKQETQNMIFNNIYQKENKISKGYNGTIYKVLDKRENKSYALKIIDYFENYEKEIEVMKK